LSRSPRSRRNYDFRSHALLGSPANAGLRQRKWDGAHGHEQKQIKCASDKMRFDSGINLLFHFGVVLV
jgi:hypothetical protein